MNRHTSRRLTQLTLATLALSGALSACAPLVIGGAAAGTVLVATDRRTSGAQLEDQGIELRAGNRISDQLGSRVRVNVTSYNRRVLLTGEVPNEQDKARVEQIVNGVENVAATFNELDIVASPSLSQRSADALTTGRVKASMVDAKDLSVNSFKVLTERGTTYLMGRVTQREADRAAEVTRTVPGVQRVVRVLEIISDEELKRLQAQTTAK